MDFKNNSMMFPAGSAEMSIISVTADGGVRLNDRELPGTLPVLALRNTVVFPGTIAPVMVSREASLALVNEASKKDLFIAACPQKHVETERPSRLSDFTGYGVIAKVIKVFEMPDGTSTAILQAFKRVLMVEVFKTNHKYLDCMVNYLQEELPAADDVQIPLLVDMLKEDTAKFLAQSPLGAADPLTALKEITDFSFLVNFVATTVELDSFEGKAELLSISDLKERGLKLLTLLRNQLAVLQMKQEINSKVKSDIDQQQREYYLNSQLRTIQEELGMDDEEDFTRMRDEAKKKQWPKEVAATFEKELRKLERFNPSAPEYSIQYNFLQFFLELPWGHVSKDNMDLMHAQKVLDEDHFGLEKVKERIIEYLAVLKLKGDMKSPILCLYGPPGVGKTSLGKSIARALGRKYVRISLGGVHDEAEIRGHRKTYVGALPRG